MKALIKQTINAYIATSERQEYVIIQPNYPTFGIFAHFINILGLLKEEIEKGNKPYIDLSTYKNCYMKDEDVGRINTWDLYFEQPFYNVSPKKVGFPIKIGKDRYMYRNCVIRYNSIYRDRNMLRPEDTMDFLTNEIGLEWWKKFTDTYIRLNDKTKDHIDSLYNQLNMSCEKRILGVLLRGTDYSDNRPKNHPITPTMDQAVERIRETVEKNDFDNIFLCTEDSRIEEAIHQEFGNNVIIPPQKRVGQVNGRLLSEIYDENSERDVYKMGLDYVSAVYLLSRCNALLSSRCGAGVAASVLGHNYEFTSFWNYGRYITQEYGEIPIIR